MYNFMLINVKTKTKWVICLGKRKRSKLMGAQSHGARPRDAQACALPTWPSTVFRGLPELFINKLPKSFYDPKPGQGEGCAMGQSPLRRAKEGILNGISPDHIGQCERPEAPLWCPLPISEVRNLRPRAAHCLAPDLPASERHVAFSGEACGHVPSAASPPAAPDGAQRRPRANGPKA